MSIQDRDDLTMPVEDTESEVEVTVDAEDVKAEYADDAKEIIKDLSDELGVIAANTRITGDIKTKGHLAISGTVRGNIEAKGNVMISGTVAGNIKCDNLLLQGGDLTDTEIIARGHVAIKEGVTVNGKIECREITIAGTVTGNVTATEQVAISSTAHFSGNLTAKTMGMEFGAKVTGSIAVSQ